MYEISSDSDEDCYDKFPQRLQKLKNKHALNNLLKVVDGPIEDKRNEPNDISLVSHQDSDVIPVLDLTAAIGLTNPPLIDLETPTIGVSTRSRSSKRKNPYIQLSPLASTQKGGKRGKGQGRGRRNQTSVSSAPQSRGRGRRSRSTQNIAYSDSVTANTSNPSPRRARGGRRRESQRNHSVSQSIITYSIGNTEDYPDLSDDQVLFNNEINKIEPSAIIALDESLDNEELSVKVFWQHLEVFKFNIRRYQKLTQIFDFFANKEGVSSDRLLFTYNYKRINKILRPDDTPESIDYNIAKFIEGGVVNKQFSINTNDTPQKKGFIVKFQCQNRKKPVELSLGQDEKLQIAMVKCAEHLEVPIAKLVFEFDGETLNGNTTPNDLDMDSGDCIDVKILM